MTSITFRAVVAGGLLLATTTLVTPAQGRSAPAPHSAVESTPAPGTSLGIASVPNLRDLGGYTTRAGAVVRRGMLYRANQLKGVSPADMEKLAALGLKNDFDLRTAAERDEAPDELPPGVNNVWLNVLADAKGGLKPAEVFRVIGDPERANDMLGGGKTETVMRETYRDFIRLPSANAAFRQLFTTLGEGGSSPALFHCTAGKDRTGWAAAALLTLLGVPKETVIQDYLRSNDYILPMYQQAMDDFVARGGEPDILPALFGVKAEYLEVTFDEMQKRYGTMERYFSEGLGINAAKQKALRAVFLTTR